MSITDLYKDPNLSGAFSGRETFYRSLKERDARTKRSKVEKALRSSDTYTLHKPTRKPSKYRRVYTKGINYLFQIDLCDMSAHASQNSGYNWIITCIDTFSKKLWAFKIKNKTGASVLKALKPLIEREKPQKIETDGGREFKNKAFAALLAKHGITTYTLTTPRKNSIVERANRTLKTRMYRAFSSRGSYKWIDILPKLIAAYNNSHHRAIKLKPSQVTRQNEATVRATLFPPQTPPKPTKLKVGDTVRVTAKKSTFQKGYEQGWSHEVFEISGIKRTNPITFAIKDIGGKVLPRSFYSSEIQIIDKSDNIWRVERVIKKRTQRNRVQYLVKWKGYSQNFNSWVNHRDLFSLG
eukprot:sb/3466156/